jgi:CRP-like cAMP-binding protein
LDLAARLGELEPFSHFTAPQLAELSAWLSRSRHAAGAVILREGEETADAYVVDAGRVRIGRVTPYGKYTLATLGPGEIFGETAFVDRSARSGDAVAEEECDLLVLDATVLSVVLDRDPRLALALYWTFWKSLAKKLRATNQMLTGFFSASRATPAAAPAGGPPRAFPVDMAAKRSLFAEQKLSGFEINFLSSLSREMQLAPRQVLFREGDPGDALYVVLDGRVMISKSVSGAGEEALAFLERGDYLGEMALIDQQPRSADARADDGGAVVLAIPREVVAGLLDMKKVSSLRLLKILCSLIAKRLREVDDKIIGWQILAAGGGALDGG